MPDLKNCVVIDTRTLQIQSYNVDAVKTVENQVVIMRPGAAFLMVVVPVDLLTWASELPAQINADLYDIEGDMKHVVEPVNYQLIETQSTILMKIYYKSLMDA